MRIAFIVGAFPRLSETFILNQITGLMDRGHCVDIFARTLSKEPAVHPDVEKYKLLDRTCHLRVPKDKFSRVLAGIGLIAANFRKNPKVILRTLNIFEYGITALSLTLLHMTAPFLRDYDVIHCQYGTNGDLGITLKRLGVQGKVVTTFHGYDIRRGLEKGESIYERLFKEGDCFIAIAAYNYKNLLKFGLDEKKMVRLPVGIDPDRFPYRWERASFENEAPIRLVTVARLVEEKGLSYGIKAVHKVLQQHPQFDLEYNIIGGGPLEETLTSLIHELGLSRVVHLLGLQRQDQVIKLLQQSHIFLLPSTAEVLPVVLMEAQAVGLPVIATAVGSTDEIVLNGESGFLVPPRDVDALADKLGCLVGQPAKWPEFGQAGRRHVKENFDINRLNDQLVQLYRRLVDEDKSGGKVESVVSASL